MVVDLQENGWVERFIAADASLAPDGEELLQASMPIRPGESPASATERLERLLDCAFRGWRARETWRRRQVLTGRSGARDLPGRTWRDRPAIDRDFAAAELGFDVLLLAAAVWLERRLVLVAGAGFLVFTLAHFAFHLTETAPLSSTSDALCRGAFAVEILIVAGVMVSMTWAPHPAIHRRTDAPTGTRHPART